MLKITVLFKIKESKKGDTKMKRGFSRIFLTILVILSLLQNSLPLHAVLYYPKRDKIVKETYSQIVTPESEITISFGQVKLEIPAGAVDQQVVISVTKLEDIDELNPGLNNATAGAVGYRFLPDGMQFLQKIKVTIPYDRERVKNEADLAGLYSYFFNKEKQYWERLERVSIDRENSLITSLTDHFTDIINGVLTLPESPTPLSFNPTSIKEIKAADPGTGINLLDPPQANNQG